MTSCICISRDDIGVGVPAAYATWLAEEWPKRCPVHSGQAYSDFLATKRMTAVATGKHVEHGELHPSLFPFQRDMTRWALQKGRAALFEDAQKIERYEGIAVRFCHGVPGFSTDIGDRWMQGNLP